MSTCFRFCLHFVLANLLFGMLVLSPLQAEEEEVKQEPPKEPLSYFLIKPNVMSLYQTSDSRLHYVSVEIQVTVRGEKKLELIETHMPLIQDTVIDFLHRQEKNIIEDTSQREVLRTNLKNRVAEVLKAETGDELLENILFTQYLYK